MSRRAMIAAILGIILGVSAGFGVVAMTDLPQVEELERYTPEGVTTLLDSRGRTVHEFFRERRIPLAFRDIPKTLKSAFLAAEDWRFYDHIGIDLRGLTRAVFRNLIERRFAEGASTITQQLAKVLFLTPEKTMARKLREVYLAIRIERRYTKDEILALYLNQIYMGAGCYGVEAAARTYFGKNASSLTLPEIAMVAGLPKAPNLYSPFKHRERARQRRDTVLRAMFERGLMSKTDYLRAREAPLPREPDTQQGVETYFAAHVLGRLSDVFGEDRVFRGHMKVETTLDLDLQRTAERAARNGLEAYASRHKIDPSETEKMPQVAVMALDPRSGEIRAMVGGRSFRESQFNRAVQAIRQPGSAFKPVLYTAAVSRGFTQSTLVDDSPVSFRIPGGRTWEPKNYDDKYSGPIPLRIALEKSKNVAAVRLLRAVGVPELRRTASRLGIDSEIAPNLSSALGSSSLRLSELALAYATIANGGIRPNIRAIRAVSSEAGANLWPPPPPSEPAIDPPVAFVVTDMLSGVIRFGTGSFAKDLPCAVAGKTGTTDDNVDSVFAGFCSNLVVVTWMGFDDRSSLGAFETGARGAGLIWKEIMSQACTAAEDEFLPPPGIVYVNVDHQTGLLPDRYSTNIVTQVFIEGTEPRHRVHTAGLPDAPFE